jgi:hypothetical protein
LKEGFNLVSSGEQRSSSRAMHDDPTNRLMLLVLLAVDCEAISLLLFAPLPSALDSIDSARNICAGNGAFSFSYVDLQKSSNNTSTARSAVVSASEA